MRWLLIIPALPTVAYLIVCALSLYNGWRYGAECLGCGHRVPNKNVPGWDSCPNHGEDLYR